MARFVEFEGVSKTYDGRSRVVEALDLAIERGEFLSLLGPSGSGKTTTLMMLAGFEVPTSGEIRLEGRSLNRVPPHRRDIGVVFQNYALFPHMSVAENVAFPLKVRGTASADREARVRRALDMVQLAAFADRRPAQLSGGQQQRVAVARALVFEPRLVLLDEPLGALDKQLREQLQLELRHLHARLGVTMVYVTHDQGEALTLSDRIAVFHHGRIQQLDTPRGLYELPENLFVAGFIGENNRLEGVLEDLRGEACNVRLAAGERVPATPRGGPGEGQAVVVAVRPERIDVHRPGRAPQSGEAALPARVAEAIYLGDHVRLRLALDGGSECVARVPAGAADRALEPGDRVQLSWQARHALAFARTV